ncbi:hypothetical protein EJ04DRAFT_516312 [Polyplosphaeria fusca]|uniref:Uncharacterized protein n=1 Tax=Polyplosphaeria fusca TaxID=682080 RepID=A0A9P4UXJ7_9PLEO|nr:hypothetical protein EJ04DRAFT_516312 [Polyplosphaeria fusca]
MTLLPSFPRNTPRIQGRVSRCPLVQLVQPLPCDTQGHPRTRSLPALPATPTDRHPSPIRSRQSHVADLSNGRRRIASLNGTMLSVPEPS